MASFEKCKVGWRARIERRGVRESRAFATKKAAELWAAERERFILDGEVSKWPKKTLADALDRYTREVTPTKKSARGEMLRLMAVERDFPELAAMLISDIQPTHIAAWRDALLKRVTPGSVKRMGNSLRAVFTLAHREWGWCGPSPFGRVTMPPDNPSRDRLIGWREARAVLRRCDYVTGHPPVSGLQNVAWAFLLALRTGMRAAEMLRLERCDLVGSVATIRQHKTEHITGKPRRVPLTPQAVRLLTQLSRFAQARGREKLLTISSDSLSAQFRAVTSALCIADLHFHDSRGCALTHLSRRVDPMTLARISGHRDLNIILRTYFRTTEEEIAARLAMPTSQRQPRPKA